MIRRAMHAFREWWVERPTVFVGPTYPAAWNSAAGPTEIVADVANAIRLVSGEDITFPWRIPQELDRDRAIDLRVLWSKPDTAVTNVTFVATYKAIAADAAFAAAATAVDTAIGAQAGLATANVVREGNWGTIAATAIASTATWLEIMIDATTLGVGITNADIYGIEIRYYRRFV
jgi:hypothetical protein